MAITSMPSDDGQELTIYIQGRFDFGAHQEFRDAYERVNTTPKRYVVDLVSATRMATGVQLGASPRASLALMKSAQALALFDGLEFVTPELIRELARPVIAHRLVMDPQARFSGRTPEIVLDEILKRLPVPA